MTARGTRPGPLLFALLNAMDGVVSDADAPNLRPASRVAAPKAALPTPPAESTRPSKFPPPDGPAPDHPSASTPLTGP